MSVEIITHCWSIDNPPFAGALCYQLSSLVLYKPKCDVQITICYDREDERVCRVVCFFIGENGFGLKMRTIEQPPPELGRRSIGRNIAALSSHADRVWFTDCDHVFGQGCIDSVNDMEWPAGHKKHRCAGMVYPGQLKIQNDHDIGDEALNEVTDYPRVVDINADDFHDKRYMKAIGGVQIVQGSYARAYGYNKEAPPWTMQPVEYPFGDFRDDIAFRRICDRNHGGIRRTFQIKELYRMRHTYKCYMGDKFKIVKGKLVKVN